MELAMPTVLVNFGATVVSGMDAAIVMSGAPRSWPPYATRTFGFLAAGCVCLGLLLGSSGAPESAAEAADAAADAKANSFDANGGSGASILASSASRKASLKAQRSAFRRFQLSYLAVYLITMLADWLQGTNMYTLYSGYNMPVGTLFLTGFISSAVVGTSVGLYVDQYGRKMGCVLFCVLEIVINTLEHYPSLPLLLVGRVLGGVSTSLLFSAFESWMVTEHRKKGFPEEWLASTHGLASTGNGLVAVLAGVLAQFASDAFGDIGPFRLAIALTAVCLALLLPWGENYGTQDTAEATSFSLAWGDVWTKTPVFLLGCIQALFEGAMYTFVFVWVPTILKTAPSTHVDLISGAVVKGSSPPLGLIFACFMVCITLGGMLFGPLTARLGLEATTALVVGLSACAMVVPVATSNFACTFGAFLVLEACVGCWFACSATMRSKYIDDKLQSSVMTIFRVPLNVLVVVGTRMEASVSLPTVFTTCAAWFGLACVLQCALAGWASGKADTLAAVAAEAKAATEGAAKPKAAKKAE